MVAATHPVGRDKGDGRGSGGYDALVKYINGRGHGGGGDGGYSGWDRGDDDDEGIYGWDDIDMLYIQMDPLML